MLPSLFVRAAQPIFIAQGGFPPNMASTHCEIHIAQIFTLAANALLENEKYSLQKLLGFLTIVYDSLSSVNKQYFVPSNMGLFTGQVVLVHKEHPRQAFPNIIKYPGTQISSEFFCWYTNIIR